MREFAGRLVDNLLIFGGTDSQKKYFCLNSLYSLQTTRCLHRIYDSLEFLYNYNSISCMTGMKYKCISLKYQHEIQKLKMRIINFDWFPEDLI